jgi:hypothetical protein
MASSVINSDDGVISGTSGLKSSGGDDGVLVFQSNGTEKFRVNTTGIDVTGTVVADGSITISDGTVAQLILDDTGQAQDWSIKAQSNYVGFFYGATQVIEIDNNSNLLFNSGYGSVATAYGCRAWVNFNGTGTPAIRASGNVSSITDGGTGIFQLNFTTAMPNTNYSVITSDNFYGLSSSNANALSTTSAEVYSYDNGFALRDPSAICVAIFR